ncbi:predicted protein, partial [Nematostella vectensis]
PLGMEDGSIPDSSITASSQNHANYSPYYGRLNNQAVSGKRWGSWAAKINQKGEYLQVDLGRVTWVTHVATQGRPKGSSYIKWVTEYTVEYSLTGDQWQSYPDGNGLLFFKIFPGNSDQTTVVKNEFSPAIKARYVRIVVQAWYSYITMRAEFYGFSSPPESDGRRPESDDGSIPDSSITASSHYSASFSPYYGRLNNQTVGGKHVGALAAKIKSKDEYLQVDLGRVTLVTHVATQGRDDFPEWVNMYTVNYSLTGDQWQSYEDENGVFPGNSDQTTVVKNEFSPVIKARYVRIVVQAWHSYITMRAEFYGCCAKKSYPLGMEDGSIPDSSITASSHYSASHSPYYGRLNNKAITNIHWGAWAAKTNQKGEYLQVDLGRVTWVTHVATQGIPKETGYMQWVIEYTVEYSLTGEQWQSYQDVNGVIKVFTGNSDQTTVVKNEFSPVIRARYVRIVAQAWYSHNTMRAEFYGYFLSGFTPLAFGQPRPTCKATGSLCHAVSMTSPKPWHGGLSGYSILPKDLPQTSGGKEASYFSILDLLQARPSHCPLGRVTLVTHVATQGRDDFPQWVTKYNVNYSLTGDQWQSYEDENGVIKVFPGNSDQTTLVKNEFFPFIKTRYVRILVQAWYYHITMRAEFYGCAA